MVPRTIDDLDYDLSDEREVDPYSLATNDERTSRTAAARRVPLGETRA